MGPHEIIEMLLKAGGVVRARWLIEASVHLPRRGTRWIASFRNEEGRQVWRSTGIQSRRKALAIAQQWEEEARRKRAAQGVPPRKPTIRVRPGSGERELGLLTQREVAVILKISERAVRAVERRAFDKIRRHPAMRDFWHEWTSGEIKEASVWALTGAEVAAVYGLARSPAERQALSKLLAVLRRSPRFLA